MYNFIIININVKIIPMTRELVYVYLNVSSSYRKTIKSMYIILLHHQVFQPPWNYSELYSTAQFKLDIYTRLTRGFLDKFLMPLTSYTWENHLNIHLHAYHSRLARQTYRVTLELHVIWTNLSCHSRVALKHWTNFLSHFQVACKCMIWCTCEVRYSRGRYENPHE